jgi:hypothetical protein
LCVPSKSSAVYEVLFYTEGFAFLEPVQCAITCTLSLAIQISFAILFIDSNTLVILYLCC